MGETLPVVKIKSRVKRGAPKIKRAGRHKAKIQAYYLKTYPRKKIRNILKNAGREKAKAWAMEHGYIGIYLEIAGK